MITKIEKDKIFSFALKSVVEGKNLKDVSKACGISQKSLKDAIQQRKQELISKETRTLQINQFLEGYTKDLLDIDRKLDLLQNFYKEKDMTPETLEKYGRIKAKFLDMKTKMESFYTKFGVLPETTGEQLQGTNITLNQTNIYADALEKYRKQKVMKNSLKTSHDNNDSNSTEAEYATTDQPGNY